MIGQVMLEVVSATTIQVKSLQRVWTSGDFTYGAWPSNDLPCLHMNVNICLYVFRLTFCGTRYHARVNCVIIIMN